MIGEEFLTVKITVIAAHIIALKSGTGRKKVEEIDAFIGQYIDERSLCAVSN